MSLRIHIITPFPDMISAVISTSILGRAEEKGIVTYQLWNLFEYADAPHNKIDDEPYGGGVGMILKPEPFFRAYDQIEKEMGDDTSLRVIFPTPDGKPFNQDDASELAMAKQLVFICGHYKGIDQRVRDHMVTDEYSVGDFIVTGGELPALLMLDGIVRLQEGVLNDMESAVTDSFSSILLDGPHYTRPREYQGWHVPDILLSGNHGEIASWRLEKRQEQTRTRRPDLWEHYMTTNQQVLE
ncbi:tRNA (guanosine(37)-N1)-methyltransferase TrmD [Candidatus Neomarinimicrobiota bacterium]